MLSALYQQRSDTHLTHCVLACRGTGFSTRFGTASQRTASKGEHTTYFASKIAPTIRAKANGVVVINFTNRESQHYSDSLCNRVAGGDKPGPGSYKDTKLSPRVARSESNHLFVLAETNSSGANRYLQVAVALIHLCVLLQRLRAARLVVRKLTG